MDLNTVIRLPDGRVGTICWHHLDGYGGVWGEHRFDEDRVRNDNYFSDELPRPEFMLREKSIEALFRRDGWHRHDIECVGTDYEILEEETDE